MVLDSLAMPKTKHPDDDTDVVYKDVVIVGNGPGAICLSYMLDGNWPYYTGEPHPGDEMLTARLNYVTRTSRFDETELNDENVENGYDKNSRRCKMTSKNQAVSLARCSRSNLGTLTSGVEGRGGGKPLALLMDQLQHPCVDIGLDLPSLITWLKAEHNTEHKIIDHVVLGKGPPGGAWQSMDPNVLTISLNRWMSLPGLHLKKWCNLVEAEEIKKSVILGERVSNSRIEEAKTTASCKAASRAPVGTVAAYYEDYVRLQNLDKYFKCGRTVTSVRAVPGSSLDDLDDYGWLIQGYENETVKTFAYRAKRVVLATGTTDSPNRLGLPGEESRPSWITHDLNDLENKLDRLASDNRDSIMTESDGSTELKVEPVLVVGAGLSAADAIMAARFRGIPVLHVFRDSSGDWGRQKGSKVSGLKLGSSNYDRLQWLPASIYPEYHKVYEMMADGGTNYPLYKALPGYTVVDFGPDGDENFAHQDRQVTLRAPNRQLQTFRVSAVAILIGSKPDLSYLGEYATRLGKIPNKPIDSNSNPIQVDDLTYEVISAPRKGLYALGPLVGDNFVRFLLGGAYGIFTHILNTSGT